MAKKENVDEDVSNKYKKYLELYKEIYITGKSEEQIQLASNQIMDIMVEKFDGSKYEQVVKAYFKEGLLTLDTISDWSNEKFITELFNESLISLEDIKLLVTKQKLPYQYLSSKYLELINNEEMEYNDRLKLIRSGFVSEADIFELYKRNLLFFLLFLLFL